MCGGRTRKFSGRAPRSVAVESQASACCIRARVSHWRMSSAVRQFSRKSPEAATWSKRVYAKFAHGGRTRSALVSEADGEVTRIFDGQASCGPSRSPKFGGDGAVTDGKAWRSARCCGSDRRVAAREEQKAVSRSARIKYGSHRLLREASVLSKMGYRKGYYRDPDEAAMTMEKKLQSG